MDIRIKALKKNLEEFLPEKVADEDQEHRKRTKSRRSYINGGGAVAWRFIIYYNYITVAIF